MISKNMCKILAEIPHLPESTTEKELQKSCSFNINLTHNILKVALSCGYIAEAKYPVFTGFFNQSVGIMQK